MGETGGEWQLGSQLLLLDGAGHHPHVEYPQEVAEAVADFAARP
jgi:pimeloyl-ACP methyl ester carboxylesterase